MAYLFPYTSTKTNVASIYCGPRNYIFGGAGSPLPAWLTLFPNQGIISVQTDDDAMVNFSPGHLVTLKACLRYYPTVCSSDVTYTVIINECQVVTFENNTSQPNIHQYIFDAAVSENIVSYTQTPLCGWTLTYTAVLSQILLPYSGTSATQGQAVFTASPPWATLDTTPTAPKWTMKSINHTDATIFTITQIATLNNKLKGVNLSKSKSIDFTVEFSDPCWGSSFVLQNSVGDTFDSTKTSPLIRTSVKYGTDDATTSAGKYVS